MTLAKPINKYIDYIDAPEDTFEQYVEKALKYNFRCVFANLQEYETGRAMLEGSDIILAGAIDFPQGTMTLEEKLARFEEYAVCGFTEIDYVLNQESVENRDFDAIEREMTAIADFCRAHGITDKVIVEMCKLTATMPPSVASVRLRWRLSRDSLRHRLAEALAALSSKTCG